MVLITTKEDGSIQGIVAMEEAGEGIQNLDGILSPGFVNAHCHLELSHMKGMIPPHTGLQEFVKQIVALRQVDAEAIQEAIVAAEQRNGIRMVLLQWEILANTLDTLRTKSKTPFSLL